ncbi:MAG: hypothetical protein GWP17_04880 [Aquificales bacterium]|nr:hypothetical protein [Aquificales bacterium]
MTNKPVETCTLNMCLVKGRGLFNINPFHKKTWQWQAQAVGPNGTYIAAFSETFKAMGDTQIGLTNNLEISNKERQKVLSVLLSEGWIPLNARHNGQTFTREIEQAS